MVRQWVLLLAFLCLAGCSRKPVAEPGMPQDSKQPAEAEIRLGGGSDQPHRLPFRMLAIHDRQKTSNAPPFHVPGGNWTVFDCQASDDPAVTFTVGVASRQDARAPIALGKAILIVKDQEAGRRFVARFGKSFPGVMPKPVERPHVPRPLELNTAILGEDRIQEASGGAFAGTGGGWAATKWFLEEEGRSAEVYFNYNLSKNEGEFREKDAEYASDLLAILASALRDGPKPERTPENDPNVTSAGPRIGKPRKLLSGQASHYLFSPGGRLAVYQDGKTILALPVDRVEGMPLVLALIDHRLGKLMVLDDELDLLVEEGIPKVAGTWSSDDPTRIWWFDGKETRRTLLRGPEKGLSLVEAPVSPDQRYVVFAASREKAGEKGKNRGVEILDRRSGKTVECQATPQGLSVVGWKKMNGGLRMAAVTNRWHIPPNEPSRLYLVDPATGKLELQKDAAAQLELDSLLSPDGKHRAHVGKEDLVVTDVQTGKERRFVLHEDDRRFVGPECIEWAGSRYLKFHGTRLALIDLTPMKMSFPKTADGAKLRGEAFKFNADASWVLYQGQTSDGEGLYLAPVEMPPDK